MKISNVGFLLAMSSPFAAAEVGLKGSQFRKLPATPPTPLSPPGSYTNSAAGRANNDPPTLEDLNEIYGQFCDICEFSDLLEQLLGIDAQYCDICDVIDEIPTEVPDLCFSAVSTVHVKGIGNVAMEDLEVGSHILTQSDKYEPVYAWGHKNPTKPAEFLQFYTKETTLEMTGGHLVFLENKKNPVRADSIQVGDVLKGSAGEVQEIKTIQRAGVYSPLTPSGTVVVDGILASSYISLQKDANEFVEFQGGISSHLSFQDFIHMALSPFRMLCMGVSPQLGNIYTEEGIPLYASAGLEFARWAEQQNIVFQLVLFLFVGALTGAFMFVENTFGASYGPLALLVAGVGYGMMKRNGILPTMKKPIRFV